MMERIIALPPTLEGWVYIIATHGPLDGPLYTWAQYTPTKTPDSIHYGMSTPEKIVDRNPYKHTLHKLHANSFSNYIHTRDLFEKMTLA